MPLLFFAHVLPLSVDLKTPFPKEVTYSVRAPAGLVGIEQDIRHHVVDEVRNDVPVLAAVMRQPKPAEVLLQVPILAASGPTSWFAAGSA